MSRKQRNQEGESNRREREIKKEADKVRSVIVKP